MIQYLDRGDVAFPEDPDAERARRVHIYSDSYRRHVEEFGLAEKRTAPRIGPYVRPVFCPDVEPHLAADRDGPAPSACFLSAQHAADYFNVSGQSVRRSVRTGGVCRGTGLRFFTVADAPLRRQLNGNELGVRCDDLGVTFESIRAAARFAGVSNSTMQLRTADGLPCGEMGYTYRLSDPPPATGDDGGDPIGGAVLDPDGDGPDPLEVAIDDDDDAWRDETADADLVSALIGLR